MPLQETVADPPQGAVTGAAAISPAGPEHTSALGNGVVQGYEYRRQDGTVERAANREEAIKLCPVIGELAMRDAEAANLLLEMASIGQAEMSKKAGRSESEKSKLTESTAKLEEHLKPTDPTKERPAKGMETMRAEVMAGTSAARPQRQVHEAVIQQIADTMEQLDTLPHDKDDKEREAEAGRQADHPVQEQQIHEATQVIITDERAVIVTEPQPVASEARIERTTTEVVGVTSPGEPALSRERRPVIKPVANEAPLDNQPTEAVNPTIELTDNTPVAAELAPDIEPAESIRRANEVDKEPLRIYEDFAEALQLLATLPVEQPAAEPENGLSAVYEIGATDNVEVQEIQTVPDIATTTAERLSELEDEDKEAVALVLEGIVETVHVIKAFEVEAAKPEVIEAMQVELEVLMIVLFSQIGVNYETEDVKDFTALLLRSDFQPSKPIAKIDDTADLERNGTREAKPSFSQRISSLSSAKDKTQHLLGQLILFYYMLTNSAHLGVEPN